MGFFVLGSETSKHFYTYLFIGFYFQYRRGYQITQFQLLLKLMCDPGRLISSSF